MTQLQKYTWLIETIRRAGNISHRELSDKWERSKDLSDGKPLPRATFNRWRDAILSQFGIIIKCRLVGGYLYYIANPEDIDEDELKKWMLDSFAVGNLIGENLSLKDRILTDQIPSGRDHLTTILEAMKENRVVDIEYKAFNTPYSFKVPVEPYCVKLYENRWYVLGHNLSKDTIRIYGLDRIESVEITDAEYSLPKVFSASEYFANYFGIVADERIKPERIVLRANADHTPYMKSLPLHHSQRLIGENGGYADFELYLAPTYDFVMKLLHVGPMVEVIEPASLRQTMKSWISKMHDLYKND
ncbi:MAG: WYL domain-containing protein [Bacteroides sp.]|nr:WYL domain-containing protein [Alistipes timonensis]MCM1311244.1 WYL domain-containing protein [Bacteroides sp.]MCM1406074.1 WYL domain-containing protein [[Clostridium] fimetarium]